MSWLDMINAGFEGLAGVAVLNHCYRVHCDRGVAGLSIASVVFFVTWGFWNLIYYPAIAQFWSFAAGIFLTLANLLYVALLLIYRQPRAR